MTAAYEPYTDAECPRCGYTEARDDGPYEPHWLDRGLPPLDPRVHLMWCGRCGRPFDVIKVENPCETCGQHAPEGADGLLMQTWSDTHTCIPPVFRRRAS
jgi:DNA-directed RNA polymerase subunit RPC12/RpoP